MKRRKTKSEGGAISIEVDSTLHLEQFDGWQLLSYDTDPATGFLFRDAGQTSDRLEILYWQQEGEQYKPQFVLEAQTGNIGIGAANPTDKLTIRGGGLAFQQAGQDQSEMGIDYDPVSQFLRIRARKGTATGLSDDVLTINKDGEVAATAIKANSLRATGANDSLTLASAGTGALLLNPAGGKVGIGRTQPKAMLDISTPEGLTGSLLRFSPSYGDGKTYHLDVRAESEQGIIRYAFGVMNNGELSPNNLVLQSGNVGIGIIPRNASLEVNGTVKATGFAGSGAQITGIKATNITEGVLAVERIPQLDQLNGQLSVTKLSGNLPIDRTSGDLPIARTSGNLPIDRTSGDLPINKTSGNLPMDRVSGNLSMDRVLGNLSTDRIIGNLSIDRITGNLSIERITGNWPLDRTSGKLPAARIDGVLSQWATSGSSISYTGKVSIGTTNSDGQLQIKGTEQDAVIKVGGTNGDAHHLSSARDMVFNSIKGDFFFRKITDFNDLKTYGESNLVAISPSGDVAIKGSISCGGKILLKTHHGTYLCAQEKNLVTQAPAPSTYERFTLEMACSREFKENIAELSAAEALATLRDLNPVKYDYKDEHTFRQNLGFIAEEMPANLASEDRKSISPFEVIPVLTRVVKEQQQTIAALQVIIQSLQANAQQSDRTPLKG